MTLHERTLPQEPVSANHELGIEDGRLHIQRLLDGSLAQAAAEGFDFAEAMDHTSHSEIYLTREEVVDTTLDIAEHAGLSDEFFSRPARTILLMGIAASWIDTEKKSQAVNGYSDAIANERHMLTDAVTALSTDGTAEESHDVEELEVFFDSIRDPELSTQVASVLLERGAGSFLEEQRADLGLTPANERSFSVRVLRIGETDDLVQAGAVDAKLDKIAYAQAQEEYESHFKERFGPLPRAFVHYKTDGTTELTLLAPTAGALFEYGDGKQIQPNNSLLTQYHHATVRHEYGHTQKSFLFGSHAQLGSIIEERKGDYLMGDRRFGGYPELGYLFDDLGFIGGINLTEVLGESIKADDSLSRFTILAANKLGLRSTLLMMLAKPPAFSDMGFMEQTFVNMDYMRNETDRSSLDALVRDMIEHQNQEELDAKTTAWASGVQAMRAVRQEMVVEELEDHEKHLRHMPRRMMTALYS